MWLFTRYGFFSIASGRDRGGRLDPGVTMIRARREAHLANLRSRFPALASAEVITTPQADYRYRIVVSKSIWTAVAAALAEEQEWSNFKNEAARCQGPAGAEYVHALHEVWDVMFRFQRSGDRRG